jgi:anion-transporting  ArsA/GET3 family ATPase
VSRHSPNEQITAKILKNPIFEMLSKEFSGAQEYMILERLADLYKRGEYDLIILDTPPSRNLIQFLEAPTMLQKLFEEKVFQWIARPTSKLLSFGIDKALGAFEQMTGSGYMTQFLELAKNLLELQTRLLESVGEVKKLLTSNELGFLLIAGPYTDQIDELIHFGKSVKSHGLQFDGLVINRSLHSGFKDLQDSTFDELSSNPNFKEARHIIRALQNREKTVIERLSHSLQKPIAEIPELARDVCGLEDLNYVANLL